MSCLRALCPTPLHLAGVCAPKFCTQTATRNTGSEVWQARDQVRIWGERLPLQRLALSQHRGTVHLLVLVAQGYMWPRGRAGPEGSPVLYLACPTFILFLLIGPSP